MNGTDLLAEFRATRAEAPFSELVRRYTNLVYSIAKRRVTDATLAQEVTQIVCIRLAKAPPKLDSEAQLLRWLQRNSRSTRSRSATSSGAGPDGSPARAAARADLSSSRPATGMYM